jgi:hypothetical protein
MCAWCLRHERKTQGGLHGQCAFSLVRILRQGSRRLVVSRFASRRLWREDRSLVGRISEAHPPIPVDGVPDAAAPYPAYEQARRAERPRDSRQVGGGVYFGASCREDSDKRFSQPGLERTPSRRPPWCNMRASVVSREYLAIQSPAKTPRQGPHRRQWQALGKVCNAALAFLRGSLRARLCGRVAVLRLLEKGNALPAQAWLATRPHSRAEWQDIRGTRH